MVEENGNLGKVTERKGSLNVVLGEHDGDALAVQTKSLDATASLVLGLAKSNLSTTTSSLSASLAERALRIASLISFLFMLKE